MAVTLQNIYLDVISYVEAAEPRSRPYETIAASGFAASVITVDDGDAWQVGDIMEIVDFTVGSSLNRVTSIATNAVTVDRDVGRVTRVGDYLSDVPLRKNPRFTYDQINQAVSAVLQELDPRIFALLTEDVAFTVDDWYDVTDTAMEEVYSAWYIEDGDFKILYHQFRTDPDNTQPKIFLAASGTSATVHLNYRRPYALVTELPDRLQELIVVGVVYKMLGSANASSSSDPGKRTKRTVQGGQEGRDSYWFYREFVRLRDAERVKLDLQVKTLPRDRRSQRSKRYIA